MKPSKRKLVGKPAQQAKRSGLTLPRYFTVPGIHPFDKLVWEKRTARIMNSHNELIFEQAEVEVPAFWSQTATNIVAQKYFYGTVGSPERESSVKQLTERVARTIANWGQKDGYFATADDAESFYAELLHLLLHQKASFNSPVWFNVGLSPAKVQCSACFINAVEDTMESILDLAKTEGLIFKYGSGAGVNLSPLRSAKENVTGGGKASGPVSFMKGYDAFSGVIKSGGKTRRAAKMVLLNIDHPDIAEFITCKAKEEKKAYALIEQGYDPEEAYASVFFQNANNSVRVTDAFMQAAADDQNWQTTAITTGKAMCTYKAQDLLRMIAESTHACGDPGLQFDTTINAWHTCPNSGRIDASNPCLAGDTLIGVADGRNAVTIRQLAEEGKSVPVYCYSHEEKRIVIRKAVQPRLTQQHAPIVKVTLDDGSCIRATPDHQFLLRDGTYCQAQDLTPNTRLMPFHSLVDKERGKHEIETCGLQQNHRVVSVIEDGYDDLYNVTVEDCHNYAIITHIAGDDLKTAKLNGIVVKNCAEFMFLPNSSCNLASLNLMQFRQENGEFEAESFLQAVHLLIIAQDILVDNSSYPNALITANSHRFRPLGLGYTNLGAFLMARGLPYDSDAGRAEAAVMTALMCGQAYKTSALLAQAQAPFEGHAENRAPMLDVMRKHQQALAQIDDALVTPALLAAAQTAWQEAFDFGNAHGYRNAQVSVLAPTGTISFLMDCDTTGIEPELALIKYKHLAGGGTLKMMNGTVPEALDRLGYTEEQQQAMLQYLETHETIEGAPHLKETDAAVFDCAFPPRNGKRVIHYLGHLKMMAAVQPFISGGISKTVNVPTTITPAEIEDIYFTAWRLGLKAVAIYRDGSKQVQPLTTSRTQKEEPAFRPVRRRLPEERQAITHKYSVGGHEGYVTVGMYEDRTPGELFLVMSKEGSTISGLMDGFATAVSLALQYGVPLEVFVNKFAHTRFEPAGFTNNRNIPLAKSVLDYIFRWLALKFSKPEDRPNVLTPEPKALNGGPAVEADTIQANERQVFQAQSDAPPCNVCGALMVRNGSCYKCLNCGSTSGCS